MKHLYCAGYAQQLANNNVLTSFLKVPELSVGSQWSRSMIEPALRTSFRVFHKKSLQYAAMGMGCILIAVSISTQPSTLRGTVNEYQPRG